jgi:hypothetical protein
MAENNGSSTLVVHNPRFRAQVVQPEALALYQPPAATSTWRPVAHAELRQVLLEQVAAKGLDLVREQYAVSANGLALFGTMDLRGPFGNADRSMALGFRHGNDKELPITLSAGTRVFVCDNLALSGTRVVLRKHTAGLNLSHSISDGLDRFLATTVKLEQSITVLESTDLTDDQAKVRLFDLHYSGLLSSSLYRQAASNYFRADAMGYADCSPRSLWGLHNATTRAAQALGPSTIQDLLVGLGRAFGLTVDGGAQVVLAG